MGVILDNKMTWSSHITYISNKISKGIGILVRARQMLYRKTLVTLYNSLIKPYLTYCICSWGSCATGKVNKLLILQKRIARLIMKSEYRAHSEPLLTELKMMTLWFTQIFCGYLLQLSAPYLSWPMAKDLFIFFQ